MLASLQDEGSFSPAKAFLAAAVEAGVDPSDGEQLERFVTGWNAGQASV
jgi:hypothetical protein